MAHANTRGTTRPQPPLTWESHPHYGIVHRSGCKICSLYMQHMIDAAFDNQPSFRTAREDHKRRIISDIERQREATEDAPGYRTELNRAHEELTWLRAELQTTQVECEWLQQRNAASAAFDMTRVRRREGSISVLLDQPKSPTASSEDSFATPATDIISQGLAASSVAASEHGDVPAYSHTSPSSIASSVGSPQLPQLPPSRPSAVQSLASYHAGPSNEPASEVYSDVAASATNTSSAPWHVAPGGRVIRTPKTIKQMNTLLKDAHVPGNIDHYKKVKELCADAHAAKDRRTEVQKYLLVKWKTPDWVRKPHASESVNALPPTNPQRDDPPEIWVAYYAVFPNSWPLGVRRDIDGKPRLSDMRASRIVARLRPEMMIDEPTTRTARLRFKETVINLFSTPRAYHQTLIRNDVAIAPQITYQPFMGLLEDITLDGVARHFAMCGISGAVAERELGPWARECQRMWNATKGDRV